MLEDSPLRPFGLPSLVSIVILCRMFFGFFFLGWVILCFFFVVFRMSGFWDLCSVAGPQDRGLNRQSCVAT